MLPLHLVRFNVPLKTNIIRLFGSPVGSTSLLNAVEAFNLDTKMDDGKPARGKVVFTGPTTVTACVDSTDVNNLDANYYTSDANPYLGFRACGFLFLNPF